MFEECQKSMIYAILATTAVVAYTVSLIFPASLAALVGYFVGISFAGYDKVNKEFKTEIDNLIQEGDTTKLIINCTLLGAAAALALSYVISPILAAVFGVFFLIFNITGAFK